MGTGTVENPHPYLRLYLGWKRWNKPETPVLPFSGGWEEWDLEGTVALELIEELIQNEERRKALKEQTMKQGPQPLRRS